MARLHEYQGKAILAANGFKVPRGRAASNADEAAAAAKQLGSEVVVKIQAWMTGRACAQTWRPFPRLVVFLLALGIGVRFIHHALFWSTMFSLHYYIVDTIVLMILGFVGYQYTRTNQMVTQYNWLYERASILSWKPKG